jgi:hypothetical protein
MWRLEVWGYDLIRVHDGYKWYICWELSKSDEIQLEAVTLSGLEGIPTYLLQLGWF